MRLPVSQRSDLPAKPGVYLFENKLKQILYIGKAINLRSRVANYFVSGGDGRAKLHQLVPQIQFIRFIEVTSEFEALLLESKLIKEHQPRYNTAAKDDKHPLYIVITEETFPRIKTARKNQLKDKDTVFGPFQSSRTVRYVLRTVREIIPYCTSQRDRGRPCFHSFLGLCNPCPKYIAAQPNVAREILTKQYRSQISLIKRLLAGHSQTVIKQIEKLMRTSAQNEQFEQAARYRDALSHLKKLLEPQTPAENFINNPEMAHQLRMQSLSILQDILNKADISLPVRSLDRIECYDISTTMGTNTTGSMVVFYQGEPATQEYRKFKIHEESKHADLPAMADMLTRRLKHLEWPLPDLFIIDGGPTQVATVQKILARMDFTVPLIGLAKREETIIVPLTIDYTSPRQYRSVSLPRSSVALQVIQHIRDEAHRFAGNYHRHLKSKAVFK